MKILVLAGGFDQIALIKELKYRGNIIYLIDYNESPPAKYYTDEYYQISTLDEEKVKELAIGKDVDMIVTACTDQALMTVAKVSEELNLPCYISSETAKNVTNKIFMKKCFIESEIPTSRYIVLDNINYSDETICNNLSFPVIVKPCDCNSSKGVLKVLDINNLREIVKKDLQLSRSGKVIVEEYICGEEISIDLWKDIEGIKIIGISKTKKIPNNKEGFTIFRSEYSNKISEDLLLSIKLIGERICNSFKLDNCPILVQAIITGNNISVIEMSARMGGGSKYKMIEYMSDVDIMKIYVERILGNTKQIITPKMSNKFIEIDYIYANDGTIDNIDGIESLIEKGIIKEVFMYKQKGDVITSRSTSSDRVLGVMLVENEEKDIILSRRIALNDMDIINTFGNSIKYVF